MSGSVEGPNLRTSKSPLVVPFARFWSCNMDMIHSKGSSWPGFSYTDEEKAEMHRVAEAAGSFEFFFAMAVIVVFTLIAAAACIGVSFWYLNARYGGDPSKTPGAVFFFCGALGILATLAGGVPLAILAGSWITARIFQTGSAAVPDAEFARRLFVKAMRQFVRMGLIVSIGLMMWWLFVPGGSKIDLFLHAVMPVLSPVVAILTAMYYFSGRVKSGRTD
jgi:hypothetical protein